MVFDITTKDNAMMFLCEFLSTTTDVINNFLTTHTTCNSWIDTTNVTAENLAEHLCIDFDALDTNTIEAVGVHYTSNDDNCASIRNIGLGDLQFAVSQETPLKVFLSNNDIAFDVQRKEMYSDGKTFDIKHTTYQSEKPLTHIAHKMYFDNQISCFFRVKDISMYIARVDKRPEFLLNLDNQFRDKRLSLQWEKNSQSYEIKFKLPIDCFATFIFYECDACCHSKKYELAKSLVDLALSVASLYDKDEVFAYLNPTVVIKPEQMLSIKRL